VVQDLMLMIRVFEIQQMTVHVIDWLILQVGVQYASGCQGLAYRFIPLPDLTPHQLITLLLIQNLVIPIIINQVVLPIQIALRVLLYMGLYSFIGSTWFSGSLPCKVGVLKTVVS
jgi:hypothetical protein